MVTLGEYVSRMKEDQKYIYYAAGESIERVNQMPQTEMILDKGYEILYFTEDVDEFAIQVVMSFQEKEFRSVSSADLGLDATGEEKETEKEQEEGKDLFNEMKEILGNKVKDVRFSKRLKNHPVCLTTEGFVSIRDGKNTQFNA